MEALNYGKNDVKSKPIALPATSVLPANRDILGTAMEKWTLTCVLSFIMGRHVPMNEECWDLIHL